MSAPPRPPGTTMSTPLDTAGTTLHADHMTSRLDNSWEEARGDQIRSSVAQRETVPPILAFVLLLVAAGMWGNLGGSNPWRLVWIPALLLTGVLVLRAIARSVRRLDELQRADFFEACGAATAAMLVACLFTGLISAVGVHLGAKSSFFIAVAGISGWLTANTRQLFRR